MTSAGKELERKVKFETASGDEVQSVIGSLLEQEQDVHHIEFSEESKENQNSNSKLANLQHNDDHATEGVPGYNAPAPPSSAASEKRSSNTSDVDDGKKVSMEDSGSTALPGPRKSLTIRRATYSGKENAVDSPKLRRPITKRRSTFSGRDSLLLPVSEQQPLDCPAGDYTYQPLEMEANNQSHSPRSLNVLQQFYRRQPRESNSPKSFRVARDSLRISQPANRVGGLTNQGFSMEWMKKSVGEHIQTNELSSNKQTGQRIKEDALPISERGKVLDCERENVDSPVYPEKDQTEYCINPKQANHQVNLPFPPRPGMKSIFAQEKNGKMHSVGDKLIANLTSAWYWSGYYAGYQQRLAEE